MPEFITSDGVRLHYSLQGAGPEHVICLHGMGGRGEDWNNVITSLETARFAFVCLDWRGHGASAHEPSLFTLERLVQDVVELSDHLAWSEFALGGHSFGGKVALLASATIPDRVRRLILCGAVGPGPVPFGRAAVEDILRQSTDIDLIREIYRPWFHAWTRPEVVEAIVQFTRTPRWALAAVTEVAFWCDVTDHVRTLDTPGLVMAGETDPVYGPTYQRESVLISLRNATLVVLPDCGHGLILERPEEIAVQITGWLDKSVSVSANAT